jgi:hypothetical protein
MECTLWNLKQKSLTKARERATSARDCRRVSVGVSVQQYSVQCKGYNLIGVTTVEASETRGTTALVYCKIAAYIQVLYKGGGVHPDWFDGQQGCSQLSTSVSNCCQQLVASWVNISSAHGGACHCSTSILNEHCERLNWLKYVSPGAHSNK